MQIVIDISKQVYNRICVIGDIDGSPVLKAIKNGTPLPEGHGRLIDTVKLKAKMFDLPQHANNGYWEGVDDVGDLIDNAPTVLEGGGGK